KPADTGKSGAAGGSGSKAPDKKGGKPSKPSKPSPPANPKGTSGGMAKDGQGGRKKAGKGNEELQRQQAKYESMRASQTGNCAQEGYDADAKPVSPPTDYAMLVAKVMFMQPDPCILDD